jgi:predicted AAA+ superfamily ATPase
MMNLKPWREIAVPHADVHKGTFVQAEFAADISRVKAGTAGEEYQNPELFFRRTFITEGMGALLGSVVRRLTGAGGDPVIQLQTAFGGGKTHTMLAVMHMVSGMGADHLKGVPEVLQTAGIDSLPETRVVVIDGNQSSPGQARKVEGAAIHTLWGELAWQLGGTDAYARVAESDQAGTSPGKNVLADLIEAHSPCVILIDELVAYVRQFEPSKTYTGGSYDSNLSFVQALTEAMKAAPRAVLLASLPESEREAGERGVHVLKTLEHYFGRVQAIWKPVSPEEAFEIVRRRLFSEFTDSSAADDVCRAFAHCYVEHKDSLPGVTQQARYYERLRKAYPIHPELFERLYEDWSSLPNFQRTRGVLKLMARVIHRLWQDNNKDLLLMPGSLPLYDTEVHGELTSYLGPGWDPVIDHDIDGTDSEAATLETQEARFGAVQACRRVTRSIFLGSAPGSVNEGARGLDTSRVVLGCLQPDQQPHVFRDALGRLETRLTYLNKSQDRWWFDVRPNLRREMEDRKRRSSAQDVHDEIRAAVRRVMGTCSLSVHVFAPSADIADDWALHLAVLPVEAVWTRDGRNPARDAAAAIVRSRGDQPRQKQNRLLFLAPDVDQIMHLKDTARALMAWRSIESDVRELRITLDNLQQRQATQYREQTQEALYRGVRETFKWLLSPSQMVKRDGSLGAVEWEAFALNPAAPGLGREVDRVLKENELIIEQWAPIHLANLLKRWFWKNDRPDVPAVDVWQKMCQYLYLPRLVSSTVMQQTIGEGARSREYFAIATARDDDRYVGFSFGHGVAIYMDAALLIDPAHAVAYEARVNAAATEADGGGVVPSIATKGAGGVSDTPGCRADANASSASEHGSTQAARLTHYFATVELDPVRAAVQFSKIQNELIGLFNGQPTAQVTIKVDIEASDDKGFDETTVRAAKENGKVLGVKNSGFD